MNVVLDNFLPLINKIGAADILTLFEDSPGLPVQGKVPLVTRIIN